MMKDSERLELLKEVAGTRVYDERRAESLAIMAETEGKLEKIQEVLSLIETRLSELKSEKEELSEFEQLDREKRTLEYALYSQDLKQTETELKGIDESRVHDKVRTREVQESGSRLMQDLKNAEQTMRELSLQSEQFARESSNLKEERQDTIKERAKRELDLKDAQDRLAADQESKVALEHELKNIETQIAARRKELAALEPLLAAEMERERAASTRLSEVEIRVQSLYSKRGRKAQFANKQQRDEFLSSEIKTIDGLIKKEEAMLETEKSKVVEIQEQIKKLESEIAQRTAQLSKRKSALEKQTVEAAAALTRRNKLTEERKDLWRKEKEISTQLETYNAELTKSERNLQMMMMRATSQGLAAVKRIAEEKKLAGVYGPLIELIDFSDERFEKYMKAVEVAGGNSLFDIVVDTDETASIILEALRQQQLGRLTFMPLNKLRVKPVELPHSIDAVPLIDNIKFKPMFQKAFQHVFGKTLLCRSLEIASQLAKTHDINCITLDGDQANRKGALTGGSFEHDGLRLSKMKNIRTWRAKIEISSGEALKLKEQLQQVDQSIALALGEQQQIDARVEKDRMTLEQLQMDMRRDQQQLLRLTDQLEPHKATVVRLGDSLSETQAKRQALASELGTELLDRLSASEQRELESLSKEIETLREQIKTHSDAHVQHASSKSRVESELALNLQRRQDEIREELSGLAVDVRAQRQAQLSDELQALEAKLASITDRQQKLDAENAALQKQLETLKQSAEQIKNKYDQHILLMEKERLDGDRRFVRRNLLVTKQSELLKKIRDLGSLPAQSFETRQSNTKVLMEQLHKVNERLKKYANVNKKAMDQFLTFTHQRDELMQRKKELDAGAKSIEELIAVLDSKKEEAIQRTFKGVAKHFSEVFAQLIPGGQARLVMLRAQSSSARGGEAEGAGEAGNGGAAAGRSGKGNGRGAAGAAGRKRAAPESDESGSDSDSQKGKAPQKRARGNDGAAGPGAGAGSGSGDFVGVSIRVSFSGKADPQMQQQLSGGQKSLVALTLIFAIQRVDSAPFYIFDEVDAALDPAYRSAVANLIRNFSASEPATQFITTTFSPELVNAADKHYGIQFKNKVSIMSAITREEALALLETDQRP
eukprot:TRINITY_DN6817_c0_g1_i1.p1 TRINITY_DN6817_c0_g1~~TRINITY_DN6817_c0_g1_i1.p1  ORF type:complete len:1266 (-),score=403.87 TRINITY_DN6817_c0_g1_i1:64-3414(-)